MTQKKQPNEAYSDEFCRGESIQAFGIDLKRFVYHQVRSHFKRHCSTHNITMEQLATTVNVPLERLQAFYELGIRYRFKSG